MPEKTKAQLAKENQALQARLMDLECQLGGELQAGQAPEMVHRARVHSVGEMAASLAHDLSQPLGAILTYSRAAIHLLKRKQSDPDELLHALHQIAAQAERGSEVIARLRRFVVPREAHRALVHLGEMVREALYLCESELRQHEVKVKVELSADSEPLMVDRLQIEQVIINLIRNAVEAMADTRPAERTIVVSSFVNEHGAAQLNISDNGCGLSVDLVKRLFQPFQTTKPHGMGMGLALSRSIIQAHGGALWAKPNPERGATFSLTVPLACGETQHGKNALRLSGR